MKRLLAAFLLAACGAPATPTKPVDPTPSTQKTLILVDDKGVGLGGHDPVSYTKGPPVAGLTDHSASHGGATYFFVTAEAKTTFESDKPKFAPAFGGYCAFAAAQNRLSVSDPRVFHLHEGQLLVFTNEDYKTRFMADPAGNKAKADANWPGLVAKHGK